MPVWNIRYKIDMDEGLQSSGEYECDEDEMRTFVARMREEYGEAVSFKLKKVGI